MFVLMRNVFFFCSTASGALFPAMTTSAKIISSVEVELSWMHKDRKHQKKLEKSSYRISCQNYPDSIVRESTKQNLTLKSLTPGTNYSCNISIPSSLSQFYETSEIAFTTPGRLELMKCEAYNHSTVSSRNFNCEVY